jgi:hypothetical protein
MRQKSPRHRTLGCLFSFLGGIVSALLFPMIPFESPGSNPDLEGMRCGLPALAAMFNGLLFGGLVGGLIGWTVGHAMPRLKSG